MSSKAGGEKRANLVFFLIICFLLVGMVVCFIFVDKPVSSWVQRNRPEVHETRWMEAIEQLGKVYPLVWLLLLGVLVTGRYKMVLVCLLALIITMPVVWSLKVTVHRPRPIDIVKAANGGERSLHSGRSFPSGDTASVFAAGTVLVSSVSWIWAIGIAFCCGGVGVLRVAELAHYPSDIFGGAALGIFCGWAAIKIMSGNPQIENILGGCERILSLIGVLLIPVLVWFFQGIDKLKILLEFYAPIAAVILVAGLIRKLQGNQVSGWN
jgi:undecaprenyl-diphosphatase